MQTISAQIDDLVEKRTQEIDSFFQKEAIAMRAMYIKQQEEQIEGMRAELTRTNQDIEQIFSPDGIVPLLILSDMLQAEELK